VAILLGGQPASGKSFLASVAEREQEQEGFLKVNGDAYRIYHPDHDVLIRDIASYSAQTQLFSNVFTEKLMEEAVKGRFNIIIEGPMRNPEIPLQTATLLKKAGFRVEARNCCSGHCYGGGNISSLYKGNKHTRIWQTGRYSLT
jgi:hypothetical protein